MTSSYADRLKARRSGGVKPNKGRTLKLNETKRIRGKIVYWNPYTKSWSSLVLPSLKMYLDSAIKKAPYGAVIILGCISYAAMWSLIVFSLCGL